MVSADHLHMILEGDLPTKEELPDGFFQLRGHRAARYLNAVAKTSRSKYVVVVSGLKMSVGMCMWTVDSKYVTTDLNCTAASDLYLQAWLSTVM